MEKYMYDFCLKQLSRAPASGRHSGILSDCDVARLCFLVCFALYFESRRSLRQRLPRLGQLEFPSKLLRRFPRGCFVFTAHGLVTVTASVCRAYVDAETEMIWMNRIVARVMSGAFKREEGRLPAAAAARIAGKSGVISAASIGDVTAVLSYLIADANCVNERDGVSWTALHRAAHNSHLAVCDLLIASRADVDADDNSECSALYCASSNGSTAVCELLIASKADVNARGWCAGRIGGCPLEVAAIYGRMAVCHLLIENKADVNAIDRDHDTALYGAASNGHTAVCELLIANKADVNAKTKDRRKTFGQRTSLHQAALEGHTAVCELLIANKADVNAKEGGVYPLRWAVQNGHSAVCELLIEHKADVNAEDGDYLHVAASDGHTAVCELLIVGKADVNARGCDRCTALHNAAREGHTAVCELLIGIKANVNAQAHGKTPLTLAILKNKPDVVALLRSVGAQ